MNYVLRSDQLRRVSAAVRESETRRLPRQSRARRYDRAPRSDGLLYAKNEGAIEIPRWGCVEMSTGSITNPPSVDGRIPLIGVVRPGLNLRQRYFLNTGDPIRPGEIGIVRGAGLGIAINENPAGAGQTTDFWDYGPLPNSFSIEAGFPGFTFFKEQLSGTQSNGSLIRVQIGEVRDILVQYNYSGGSNGTLSSTATPIEQKGAARGFNALPITYGGFELQNFRTAALAGGPYIGLARLEHSQRTLGGFLTLVCAFAAVP